MKPEPVRAAYPLRVLAPLLLAGVLLLIALAAYWMKQPAQAVAVDCPDPLAGCAFAHRGSTVTLRFASPPTPLQAFGIAVSAPGAARISATFQMVGMEMGFNRYDLQPAGDGAFAASVTLPVCVSGRHDWMMYLDIDGSIYALPFRTH